jgi:multidrug efflux pump subunit AcrA (membrane-fusion protein)
VAENGQIKLLRESLNPVAVAQALLPGGVKDLPDPEKVIFTVPPDYRSWGRREFFRAVAGAISKVQVDDNQLLKKGDPIARLDPRDYEMALAQAGANLSEKFIL